MRRSLSTLSHLLIAFTCVLAGCARPFPVAGLEAPRAAVPERGGMEDPKLLAYLAGEQRYFDDATHPLSELRDRLKSEIMALQAPAISELGIEVGKYSFVIAREPGGRLPVIRRKLRGSQGEPVKVLELDSSFPERSDTEIGLLRLSPDGERIAFTADMGKRRSFMLFVRDLRDGTMWAGNQDSVEEAEWACGGERLVFSTAEGLRPSKVFVSEGRGEAASRLLFEERDPAFFVGLSRARSGRFVFARSASSVTSEVLAMDGCEESLRSIAGRKPGVLYTAEHSGDDLLILTNEGAPDFKVMRQPIGGGEASEAIPERPESVLECLEVFDRFTVQIRRERGARKAIFTDLGSGRSLEPDLGDTPHSLSFLPNPDPGTGKLQAIYSSMALPRHSLTFDYGSFTFGPLPAPSESRYASERIYARAADGTAIPITIFYNRRERPSQPGALLLYAYGAYGNEPSLGYSPSRRMLLDRGFVIAIAHVRGGGFRGAEWHQAGSGINKRRSIDDLLTAAERLRKDGYGATDRLYLMGRSAGGLLVASALAKRPELFEAVVLEAPFLDVIRAMSDLSEPLTARERAEWGDPNNPSDRSGMLAYAPMELLRPGYYPHALVIASLGDRAVSFREASRWVYRVRQVNQGATQTILRLHLEDDHLGPSDGWQSAEEEALKASFLLAIDSATSR